MTERNLKILGHDAKISIVEIDAVDPYCSQVLRAKGQSAQLVAEFLGIASAASEQLALFYLDRTDTLGANRPAGIPYRHGVIFYKDGTSAHFTKDVSELIRLLKGS